MKILKIIGTAVLLTAALAACEKKPPDINNPAQADTKNKNLNGMTVTWLGSYDITKDSTAIALFEETGAKIDYIYSPAIDIAYYTQLRMLNGEPVDMAEFNPDVFPKGYNMDIYEPLDSYADMKLWDGAAKDLADSLAYNGKHYVLPTRIRMSSGLQYDKKLFEEENLEDPYDLYKGGKWTWGKFLEMSEEYTEKGTEQKPRYAVSGVFGVPAYYTGGDTFLKNDGTGWTANTSAPTFANIGQILQNVSGMYLKDTDWHSSYNADNNALFHAMGDWSLDIANTDNPDGDISYVPFPKPEGADRHYALAEFDAYLLVKDSPNAYGVAKYIECERIAESSDEYEKERREYVLNDRNITPEQYDLIKEYEKDVIPVYDYVLGLGKEITKTGEDSFYSRGALINTAEAILRDGMKWTEIADPIGDIINQALEAQQ
ncbi:MAG: ABC transporter substrate-binding protein [Oscillospiraceae bacterium]|jgi:multiple sugar transport system substrate-binding protein|nr:ABC transporter substrate-binding protein [Oscillospiraceae bacterium]